MFSRTYQWARRETRKVIREHICPLAFYASGGSLYDTERPVDGVESVQVAPEIIGECPAVKDAINGRTYRALRQNYPAIYTHRIDASQLELSVLASGGILLGSKQLLHSGIHPYAAMREAISSKATAQREASLLVIPWAHPWYTFGDFTMLILPVLARLLRGISPAEKAQAIIPLRGVSQNPWVSDYCAILGLNPEQLVDPALVPLKMKAGGTVITSSGLPLNGANAHPHDLTALRSEVREIYPAPDKSTKLYLPRSGRRRYLEEAKLIPQLEAMGFTIYPEGLTAREQIELFAAAKVICGPHGGAFGNIVFAEEGTQVFEWPHPYWMSACFRQSAHLLGLDYHIAMNASLEPSYDCIHGYAHADIDLPVEAIMKSLQTVTS